MSCNKCSCNIKALFEVESANDRFESIGENIGIFLPERECLSSRELDRTRKSEMSCYLSKIASSHEGRSDISEFPFWFLREVMKKCLGNSDFEHGISEEFKTFIGFTVSHVGFIEDTAVDTGEDIELWVLRENLERREEGAYLRFKLSAVIAE
jgi:hypothetical protein